ncbi:RNA ligase family protein [Sorangium sp. So ce145]|uniref:RNA ligase family protein n=1 Tax=Sorangium sp. So ce145 TaxID=3133285 RepID=UPI003F5E1688
MAELERPLREPRAPDVRGLGRAARDLVSRAAPPGGWLVGEWLALAHSTRYELRHEPFVVFDAFHEGRQWTFDELDARLRGAFPRPALLHRGGALGISAMLERLGRGGHGAIEPPEGAVWRVERAGRVVGMAKYVRGDKIDGALLPENSGHEAVWNWKP